LRRRQRRPESPLDLDDESGRENERCLPGDDPPPDVALVARERKGLVREALAGLPEHYRTVVVLRHYEGLRFREIAELLDIPIGTVKSRMAEALDRLARALGPEMTCDPVRDAIATGRSRV
jgi:RNA polymerase sigma-70 factor (ECF subfamily)